MKFKDTLSKLDAQAEVLKIPEFDSNLEWFNSLPLSFQKNLLGKIVVLDFWTYCCINCMHVLPELAELEAKYSQFPVVFIGIHSPKFHNEKHSQNIRQAILRYEIHHPVVNDPEMTMWKTLGVNSWPTFVIVGPKNNLLFSISGEGKKEVLDEMIADTLKFYGQKAFDSAPVPIVLEKLKPSSPSPLKFPGKLAIDEQNGRLFISDSNNHRVVVTTLQGQLLNIIGKGEAGLQDGSYQKARFNRLQGIAYRDEKLFVADAENHALREIDLKKERVVTLAGDGIQGRDYQGGYPGKKQRLSTPWDLAFSEDGQQLFIAMAGTHQIWAHQFSTGKTMNFSGSGREANDNSDRLLDAAWAQPSGICLANHQLIIADSESSSIRAIDLIHLKTRTIAGGDWSNPYNLFCFGDRDGKGSQARLQHPLGVGWLPTEKRVIVTDTYNHRLKLLDPETGMLQAWVGSGHSGYRDGKGLEAQFSEPAGVAVLSDGTKVFVADTNNHLIRVVELPSLQVSTFSMIMS